MAEKDRCIPDIEGTESRNPVSPAYSRFSARQKGCIVALVAFAGWFSSLSSFIYFPAIPFLAEDLNTSIQDVNLTVTAYLTMSGIFPALVGNAADIFGRRPVFIATLFIYVGANLGLALQSSYGLLFFLRMVQSAGISGSYAVTYGVIGDLFTPAERGGYSGIISFVLNTPPSIGPVLSGLLLQRWTWRSIFWFLSIASPCCLVLIIVFLPETSRQIVKDGSVASTKMNRPLISVLQPPQSLPAANMEEDLARSRGWKLPNPIKPVLLLRRAGAAVIIGVVAVYYTVYSCLQASLGSLFVELYKADGLTSGLIYLPFGLGCALGAFATGLAPEQFLHVYINDNFLMQRVSGKILDFEYAATARRHHIRVDRGADHDFAAFPIEEARLGSLKYQLLLCCALTIAYGWLLRYQIHMAAPLVLQLFIGLTIQGVFTTGSTLLVDTHPDCPSTAQAALNLVRCELAAGGLAALDAILRRIGPGWCFVLFGLLAAACVPILFLLQARGKTWRAGGSMSG